MLAYIQVSVSRGKSRASSLGADVIGGDGSPLAP